MKINICQLQIGVFMYEYVNSALPSVFSDIFSYNYDCRNINTRSSLNFHILCSKQVLHIFGIGNTGCVTEYLMNEACKVTCCV